MDQNIKLAISKDELMENEQCSCMVGDTFRILKHSAIRAFDTQDINAACVIVNLIFQILEDSYKDFLTKQLNEVLGLNSNKLITVFQQEKEDYTKAIITLNNMDQSAEFTRRLKETLEDQTEKTFDDLDQKDRRKMHNCIENLNESIKGFSRNAETGVKYHFRNYAFLVDDNITSNV
eukprot:UN34490